jgi:3-hydroxyacyl-CoA dehydrogenase
VADGHLGRKTGRGIYSYESDTPAPAVDIRRRPLEIPEGLHRAVDDFVAVATDKQGNDVQRYVFSRILVSLIAQAALAHERGVAEKSDIDTLPEGPVRMVRADRPRQVRQAARSPQRNGHR